MAVSPFAGWPASCVEEVAPEMFSVASVVELHTPGMLLAPPFHEKTERYRCDIAWGCPSENGRLAVLEFVDEGGL